MFALIPQTNYGPWVESVGNASVTPSPNPGKSPSSGGGLPWGQELQESRLHTCTGGCCPVISSLEDEGEVYHLLPFQFSRATLPAILSIFLVTLTSLKLLGTCPKLDSGEGGSGSWGVCLMFERWGASEDSLLVWRDGGSPPQRNLCHQK